MDDPHQTSEQTSAFSPDITNSNGTGSPRIHSQLTSNEGNTRVMNRNMRESVRIFIRAYSASLSILGTVIPVIASFITVGLYLTLPNSTSQWYILLVGGLIAVIFWFVIAIPVCGLCTAQGANSHNYGLLQSRLHQLKASLSLEGFADGDYEGIKSLKTIMEHAGFDEKNNKHQWEVVKEAYACCIEISRMLYKFPSGLRWVVGMGYNTAWTILHHGEEAMIEVADIGTVIRGAKHDFLSIQGSYMKGKDGLLVDIIQAVAVLKHEALIYFREHQPSKINMALSQTQQQKNNSNLSSSAASASDGSITDPPPVLDKPITNTIAQTELEAISRLTLREVRSALNDFREKRWEGLVRQRTRLLKATVVTGIVTYVLLGVIILAFNSIDSKQNLLAATIIYMVGAISGLFVRFYSESHSGKSIDDFGLSTTRLVAIPLLSGLAGIGGVLLSEILAAMESNIGIPNLFTLQPRALLIAAVFGATPNLFIRGLQKQAHEYETELQSSKAAEKPVEETSETI